MLPHLKRFLKSLKTVIHFFKPMLHNSRHWSEIQYVKHFFSLCFKQKRKIFDYIRLRKYFK